MEKINTAIGSKIRSFREAARITEEEFSQRTGLSLSFLEALDKNEEIPALGDLIKIARVLGIRLGTLLDDQPCEGPVVSRAEEQHMVPVVRSKDGSCGNISYFSLSQNKPDRHMETYMIDLHPSEEVEKRLSSHEGEEFLYVRSGRVEVIYGKEKYLLSPGDTIYFDSIVPHYIGSASCSETAGILAVLYIPS